jgi:hypothetical protein
MWTTAAFTPKCQRPFHGSSKTAPPLRTDEDMQAILDGLSLGWHSSRGIVEC